MGMRHATIRRSAGCLFTLVAFAASARAGEAETEAKSELSSASPTVPTATGDAPVTASAAETGAPAAPALEEAPYPPAPPEFASGRPAMPKDDWIKKPQGAYFTGLPLVNSDPNTGFGFGLRLFRFDNGTRESALFPYRAFDQRVFAQYFQTTNGLQYHMLSFDAPFFLDGPHRLKVDAVFDKNSSANWYGFGEAARGGLVDPITRQRFDAMGDYQRALDQVNDRGETYALYNRYEIQRPTLNATWEELYDGSRLRLIAGFMAQHVSIKDTTGFTAMGTRGGDEAEGRNVTSLVGERCAAGELVGCGGGFNNALKLAVSYDMRDFEPDPNSGYVLEASTQLSGTATGSADTYARASVQARGYWSPFPEVADLVLAGRALYAANTGDVPFYALPTITLADGEIEGLGGRTTLRGFKQNRFIGRVAALANAEIRWTFVDFKTVGQRFGLMLVPFADFGRTFERVSDTALSGFKASYGAGFRIAWNQATVINVDYGRSNEDAGLYINFGHPF
jgi:outer membrane protein assembly factor BamA